MSMFMDYNTNMAFLFPFQRVKDEVQRRKMQCVSCHERQDDELRFPKPAGHAQFHASLDAARLTPACVVPECPWDLPSSPPRQSQKVEGKRPSTSPFSVSDD
jgi:hypothetical protein